MFKTLFKSIFGDLRLKGFALAIALAIWFYASGQIRDETSLAVPLVVTAPENHKVVHTSVDRAILRFVGPRSLIERLEDIARQDELQIVTSLTPEQCQGTRVRLEVKREWLEVKYWLGMTKNELSELHVTVVPPDYVDVYASELQLNSRMPVNVRLSGQPPQDYEVRDTIPTPSLVAVTAPALLLEQMKGVDTTPISVAYRRSDFPREGVPLVQQQNVELEGGLVVPVAFECRPLRVDVAVKIHAVRVSKRLESVPVVWFEPFRYKVGIASEDRTISVTVSGLQTDVDELTADSIRAYIDLKALDDVVVEPGRNAPYKVPVKLILPEDMTDIEARPEPSEISVTLRNP
jgi:hypothetical protein